MFKQVIKADGSYRKDKSGLKVRGWSMQQDIGVYNGKVLVIRYDPNVKDKNSTIERPRHAIDVYDGNTLEYLGTNIIHLGDRTELESIDYYEDGFFAIHYCYPGTSKPARVSKIFINLGN